MLSLNEFVESFNLLTRAELIDEGEMLVYSSERMGTFKINKDELQNILNRLDKKEHKEETVLFDRNSFEVLIRIEGARPVFHSRTIYYAEDNQNGLTFDLSPASDEYLIYYMNQVNKKGMLREFRRYGPVNWDRFKSVNGETGNIIDLLRNYLQRICTLKITSTQFKRFADFEELSNSFIFQLSFNYDIVPIEIRLLDDFIRPQRINRIRRAKPDEIEPPKRKYIADLVYHYQMAISTDSPLLSYIAYYHIYEHFFEKVYNDQLVHLIQAEITRPNFSPKKESDVKKLIKLLDNKLSSRRETYVFNEKEALRLTFAKFVDLQKINESLREYDETLIDFYKTNELTFSNGDTVDLAGGDEFQIFKQLAERIYKTRNAIVHSKETEKSKYVPFKHDKNLKKELPLLRFLAEDIILSNSNII